MSTPRRHAVIFGIILIASVVLSICGISWGLPSGRGWAPDEIFPAQVKGGMRNWFSLRHGSIYPPFHFYILGLLYRVAWSFELFGRDGDLFYVGRVLSVVMAAGVIVLLYVTTCRVLDRTSALFAAAILSSNVTFAYYAKLANLDVPYLFWFALSMYFYVRGMQTGRLRDSVLFVSTAAISVGTKDQAYGLYVLTIPLYFHLLYRDFFRERFARLSFLRSKYMVLPLCSGAVIFCLIHKLPVNLDGFIAHLQCITGSASGDYRAFEGTFRGQLGLILRTAKNFSFAASFPLFIICLLGMAGEFLRRNGNTHLRSLVVPVVSYHATFIAIILYSYDRFLLPVCFLFAPFGGMVLARFIAACPSFFKLRVAVVAGVFVVAISRVIYLDWMMLNDSRYVVEAWMEKNISPGKRVGLLGPREYLPRIETPNQIELRPSMDILESDAVDYIVVNRDYAERFSPDRPESHFYTQLLSGQTAFKPVFQYRTVPLIELVASRPRASNLAKINPEIVVLER